MSDNTKHPMRHVGELIQDSDFEKINLRPSSITGFDICPAKWYMIHVLKRESAPRTTFNSYQGTAFHGGVESFWSAAMEHKSLPSASEMTHYAVTVLDEDLNSKGLRVDQLEFGKKGITSHSSMLDAISRGLTEYRNHMIARVEKYGEIPIGVECEVKLPIEDNNVVGSIGGTIDILFPNYIADIKTSGTPPRQGANPNAGMGKHIVQQGIYKALAIGNNLVPDNAGCEIHQVTLQQTKVAVHVQPIVPDSDLVAYKVNNILSRLQLLSNNPHVPVDLLFPTSSASTLCGRKYCEYFDICHANLNQGD